MINHAIDKSQSIQHAYYSVVRYPLVNLLNGCAGSVLEIGCGTGQTLEYLKKTGAKEVVGVELREEVATAALENKLIDEVYQANFLDEVSPLKGRLFDTVILSHVLEHFTEPNVVLDKVRTHMHPKSTLLIAVPNVRHVTVLVPLAIMGHFDYTDTGILDHTHCRLYTRKSIIRTLKRNGFTIKLAKMDFGGAKSRTANKLSFGFFEEFLGYAINVSAGLE